MKFLVYIFIVIFAVFHNCAASMVGGWSKVSDVNSTDFQKIVSFAEAKMSQMSNSLYVMRALEVLDAEKQVVSGMNYKFTVRLGATECKKNKVDIANVNVANECPFLHCGPIESCNLYVWDQAWQANGTKVTKYSCQHETQQC